jgi:hypothetical protein
MILNEITTLEGILIEQTVENSDGSIVVINYDNGIEISRETIINPYPALNETGALATLLVVMGIIPLEDASNAIHEQPEHLIAEAEAWSIASQ